MDLKSCYERLDKILKNHQHAYILNLISIHLENSTIESQNAESKKKHTRVYDDALSVTVTESRGQDDVQIDQIVFLEDKVPVYLQMEEILTIFESGTTEKTVTVELFSSTKIEGNFNFGLCTVFSNDGRLFLNTKINLYDEEIVKDARNLHAIKFVNQDIINDLVTDLVKLLALCIVTTIEFEGRHSEELPTEQAPLIQISKTYKNGQRFYHDKERNIDTYLITEIMSAYQALDGTSLLQLKRALRWVEKNENASGSDLMLHTAIMIEALMGEPDYSMCDVCKQKQYAVGMTQNYVNFFLQYSDLPEEIAKNSAKEMYDIRCRISHDGKLLPYDDPAMKLRKQFFVFQPSSPRYFLARWILNWIKAKSV